MLLPRASSAPVRWLALLPTAPDRGHSLSPEGLKALPVTRLALDESLPAALWKQLEPLSLLDRMLLFQLRTQMSQEDRDLTHPHVILLFTPEELSGRHMNDGRAALLEKVRRAESAEAQRGRAGHWAYDPGRHERLERLIQSLAKPVARAEDETDAEELVA